MALQTHGNIEFSNIPENASQRVKSARFVMPTTLAPGTPEEMLSQFFNNVDQDSMKELINIQSFKQSEEEVYRKCKEEGFMSLFNEDNDSDFLELIGNIFAQDPNYYKDESKLSELIYTNYQNYIKQIYLTKQLTTLNTEYDNGLIRKLSPKGCLGIFANKDFKEGETVCRYGIHFINSNNDYGNSRSEYDKNVFDVDIYNHDGSGMTWWHDRKLNDYSSDVYKGIGRFAMSAVGSPHADLNKDQRFWGHLINDLKPIFFDRLNMVAVRDIKKGEELGCLYGKTYWYNPDGSCKNRHTPTWRSNYTDQV